MRKKWRKITKKKEKNHEPCSQKVIRSECVEQCVWVLSATLKKKNKEKNEKINNFEKQSTSEKLRAFQQQVLDLHDLRRFVIKCEKIKIIFKKHILMMMVCAKKWKRNRNVCMADENKW